METGDAVDLVAGGKAHVGHVDLTVADDHVAAHLLAVAEAADQIVAPAAVDLAHDLPQAGQQLLHQGLGPFFQGLGHDGVVGIGHAALDDLPGLVPAQAVLIHEDAHQLGDDEGGVGVIDLDGVVLGKALDVAPLFDVLAHDVLGGGRDEEVLLLQAQGLAFHVVIGRVEHLGDHLGHGALLHALDILSLGEQVHIQGVGTLGVPQAENVDLLSAVAGDEHIPGHGDDGVIVSVLGMIMAEIVPMGLDLAAEANLYRVLIVGDQPALGGAAPIVGHLGLFAVHKLLLEHTQLVADGIAGALQALGGDGVHIAGGKTAKAAIAQAGVRLFLEDVGGAAAHILQGAGDCVGNAQVIGILHQAAAHQKFHGHVVNFFFRVFGVLSGQEPAHQLANDDGGGLEDLPVGGDLAGYSKMGAELILDGAAHLVAGNLVGH